jgi:predicted nucleotidyltransferase
MRAMKLAKLQLDSEKIAAFCRRHRIRRLALFGSVLRDDFSAGSDVDVLVEFEPGAKTGLAFFGMQDELSEIVGRKVDLHTPGLLGPRVRDRVLKETQDVYVAA